MTGLTTVQKNTRAPQAFPRLAALGRLARRQKAGAVALVLLLGIVALTVAADVITRYAPSDPVARPFLMPSAAHLLGTDYLGRDIFSQIVYGARVSVVVAALSIALSLAIGMPIGLICGFRGGRVDLFIQRIVDILVTLPSLVLALALVAMLGPGLRNVILAIGIVQGPRVSRVIRAATMSIRQGVFIEAARSLGCSEGRVIIRHVLPNTLPIALTIGSALAGEAIIVEAALSFLGLGVLPPTPSWGQMLTTSAQLYFISHPWLAIPPGVAIIVTVLAANLFGDALQEMLDPRLRGRH
jgi:peptide/nickel transport system permease protein